MTMESKDFYFVQLLEEDPTPDVVFTYTYTENGSCYITSTGGDSPTSTTVEPYPYPTHDYPSYDKPVFEIYESSSPVLHVWQACPVCDGEGYIPVAYISIDGTGSDYIYLNNTPHKPCPKCDTECIISRVDGRLPSEV